MNASRLEPLRDGIFAFAMTLLVLDVKVPLLVLHSSPTQALLHALLHLVPNFLSYLMSFVALSVLWIAHHNQMHLITKTERPFLWINIAFFFLVTIIPFSAGFLGAYPLQPVGLLFYTFNMIGCSTGLLCIWNYAVRKQLVKEVTQEFIDIVNLRILTPLLVYLLALVCAFFSPLLSFLCLLMAIGVNFLPGKLDESLFSTRFEGKRYNGGGKLDRPMR